MLHFSMIQIIDAKLVVKKNDNRFDSLDRYARFNRDNRQVS